MHYNMLHKPWITAHSCVPAVTTHRHCRSTLAPASRRHQVNIVACIFQTTKWLIEYFCIPIMLLLKMCSMCSVTALISTWLQLPLPFNCCIHRKLSARNRGEWRRCNSTLTTTSTTLATIEHQPTANKSHAKSFRNWLECWRSGWCSWENESFTLLKIFAWSRWCYCCWFERCCYCYTVTAQAVLSQSLRLPLSVIASHLEMTLKRWHKRQNEAMWTSALASKAQHGWASKVVEVL